MTAATETDHSLSANILAREFDRLQKAHVLCVGDVMLDRFVYGAVDRISPEAPIPVFLVEREKEMLGGAGNVVANIASLGGRATLLAVTGIDTAGDTIAKLLAEQGITAALVQESGRQTILKTRFVGAGQQMLRVDRERAAPLAATTEAQLMEKAASLIPRAGAVILSDYGKGVLGDKVIQGIIALAQKNGVPVIVDPKGADFSKYAGASIVTPNRKELETATRLKAATDTEVVKAAQKVIETCDIGAVLATRSKDGMSLVEKNTPAPLHIPSVVREVYDVSGAGDTVIACFATAMAAGVSLRNAAFLANIAAGIAVGKAGTATVRPDEMTAAIDTAANVNKTASRESHKVVTLKAAADQAERWRGRGFSVGFTNGCFDLLHPGHLSTLRQAKAACDYLVVGVNSDASVKRLKGESRPVQDETARAAVLSALEMVDIVVIFGEDTPIDLIRAIKPDVLVKGGQYKLEEVVGYDVVMSYGGKIVRADMEDGFSTTNTIGRMAAK